MFEWDDARYFLAIHREGSLAAAAPQLGVNPSTVGRRLSQLEDRVRARLFLRTREGFSLTPSGERLLPHAERMEEDAHALERAALGQQSDLVGTVRITAGDVTSARIVVPALADFRALFPAIALELVADKRNLDLARREADVALRFGRPDSPKLVGRRLSGFAYAPYASAGYIERRGRPGPKSFCHHDFIGFDQKLGGLSPDDWVERQAREGQIVLRSSSTLAQIAAAAAGMGVAYLPCYLADEEPTLVRLAPPEPGPRRSLWLVTHADLQHAAPIRACSDFLAQRVTRMRRQLEGLTVSPA